ncbi:MAG: outer membrane protein assembly factor BamD, partial [Alistipes sp.]|nr:outer membrane protein assembly factor BamD [Alistipes sp.]
TMTGEALRAIGDFISHYPQSEQVDSFLKISEELNERLHEKAYLNAYTYYKIGRYKSAITALKNALKEYPESKHREEIMYLIVDASYRFANNSIDAKQTDRYLAMLDSYLSFKEAYPESSRMKEVERMAKHARNYLDRNNKDNI